LLSSLRARTQRLSRIVLMCPARARASCAFFFFHDPATTEIYTLSLHDALRSGRERGVPRRADAGRSAGLYARPAHHVPHAAGGRSEEHTSELQSRVDLVCRLLLEKKKTQALYRARSRSAAKQLVCSFQIALTE